MSYLIFYDDEEINTAVRHVKKLESDNKSAVKMIDDLIEKVDALNAVIKNIKIENEKRMRIKDYLIRVLQRENTSLNHEHPKFARCKFAGERGRGYYESFNLPIIEQDYWRFECGKR